MSRAYAILFLISGTLALRRLPINDNVNAVSFEKEEAVCMAKFEHHSEEMLRLLDYPQLMCSPPFPANHKFSFSKIAEYPETHLEVKKDPKRTHIIVEGSESSGSHFMVKLVAESMGIQVRGDETVTDDVVLYHVSQPEGATCQQITQVPLLDDYGCVENSSTAGCEMPLKKHHRVLIKVKDVVRKYKERGESIKIIQTVRDPEIAMLANHRIHCPNESLEIEDNEIAFRLMLDAHKLAEVTTVCYEQMLEEGEPYVRSLFQKAGLNGNLKAFPNIKNGNAKYTVSERKCTFSSKAYMTLCPDSPHTKELRRLGCNEQE